MFTHEMMTIALGKVKRSGFHHFLTSVLYVKRAAEAELDVLGGVMVVIWSAGVLLLMRLVLAN
jgi:hypothetical protein